MSFGTDLNQLCLSKISLTKARNSNLKMTSKLSKTVGITGKTRTFGHSNFRILLQESSQLLLLIAATCLQLPPALLLVIKMKILQRTSSREWASKVLIVHKLLSRKQIKKHK